MRRLISTLCTRFALPLSVAMSALSASSVAAGPLSLANAPLFLGGVVQPNVMLTLDDSSSMSWSFVPDAVYDLVGTKRGLAAERNPLAFNPRYKYSLPAGVSANIPTFAAAYKDGYLPGDKVDLSSNYKPSWKDDDGDYETLGGTGFYPTDASGEWYGATAGSYPAFYYAFWQNDPRTATPTAPVGCDGTAELPIQLDTDACYVAVKVGEGPGIDGVPETTNFTYWYSYYRKRIYSAKAAASFAVSSMGDASRIGFGTINKPVTESVALLTSAHRAKLITDINAVTPSGSTPLREAAEEVGEYFDGNDGLWADRSCRRAIHVVVSDGGWTNSDEFSVANWDGDPPQAAPDGESYGVDPFADEFADTLADVAMKYWAQDLSVASNNVPVTPKDPASWQHLQLFAIGFGLELGDISPVEAFAAIYESPPPKLDWWGTAPESGSVDDYWSVPYRTTDLLHAAVNSRGEFLNVADFEAIHGALGSVLTSAPGTAGSSASVVLNSGSLRGSTRIYQARFITNDASTGVGAKSDWSGELLAYAVNADGTVGALLGDAGKKIPACADGATADCEARFIATHNGTKGVPFRWSQLSNAQKNYLGANASEQQNILRYLRGNKSMEGGIYRWRSTLLGDIINSAPTYVGSPSAPYLDVWCDEVDINGNCSKAVEDGKPYSQFRQAKASRKDIIYVGANDGMLHAFDADSMVELFAYVPAEVLPGLKGLADPDYFSKHRYFADGSPTVGDAFFNSDWHTVVVAGLNAGGKSVYALDVTEPEKIVDETTLAARVLWEFKHTDLGYTFSRPSVVRLNNGKWAAIFGNGYNSASGKAALFVVDLATGKLVTNSPIYTDTGSAADPSGLATVAPVDQDGDYNADIVYAGDIKGNLWKFDLRSKTPSQWGVSGAGSTNNKKYPIFTATSKEGAPQAITTRPQAVPHPTGGGFIVLFGTGKFLEGTDMDRNPSTGNSPATQTFYGIWDTYDNDNSSDAKQLNYGAKAITRDVLQPQTILNETTVSGIRYRVTSDNKFAWKTWEDVNSGFLGWYMDLEYEGNNRGERQISDPVLRAGRIIFTTAIPDADACKFGGDGWLMELDAETGGRFTYSPFDVNGDGVFTVGDYVSISGDEANTDTAPPSGRSKAGIGIVPTPAILARNDGTKEYKYMSGSSGTIDVVAESKGESDFGRQSWRQLFQ